MSTPIDFEQLTAEINEEVRRRRQAGDFPPGLERELDELFAQFAPKKVSLDDLSSLMAKAEEASFLDSDAPTGSFRKGGAVVKQTIAKGVGWYVRYLAQNTTVYASTVSRILRLLDAKIEVLNDKVFAVPGRVAEVAATAPPTSANISAWQGLILEAVTSGRGRVLHAESGSGELVGGLIAAGVDAYGIEPSDVLATAAAAATLDVRVDDALTHLRQLPDEALRGVILSGCVDRLAIAEKIELVALASVKTSRGGTVVIAGTNPAAANSADPVAADLAPGRPLHPRTWEHLLASRGLAVDSTTWAPSPARIEPLKVKGSDAFNAQIDAINAALFPPQTYCIIARRSS